MNTVFRIPWNRRESRPLVFDTSGKVVQKEAFCTPPQRVLVDVFVGKVG